MESMGGKCPKQDLGKEKCKGWLGNVGEIFSAKGLAGRV
jgi:hypothetical protein